MYAIIKGKRYNTETAECLCDVSPSGLTPSDFRYEDTGLYVTKNGRFFLAGKGGPMTRWARPYGQNGRRSGSGVMPIEPNEARELMERYGIPDDIERFFNVEDA